MISAIQILNFDVDDLRARLRKVSDEKLREFGEAARYMTTPRAIICSMAPSVMSFFQLSVF
jgi:hypothetical protein